MFSSAIIVLLSCYPDKNIKTIPKKYMMYFSFILQDKINVFVLREMLEGMRYVSVATWFVIRENLFSGFPIKSDKPACTVTKKAISLKFLI